MPDSGLYMLVCVQCWLVLPQLYPPRFLLWYCLWSLFRHRCRVSNLSRNPDMRVHHTYYLYYNGGWSPVVCENNCLFYYNYCWYHCLLLHSVNSPHCTLAGLFCAFLRVMDDAPRPRMHPHSPWCIRPDGVPSGTGILDSHGPHHIHRSNNSTNYCVSCTDLVGCGRIRLLLDCCLLEGEYSLSMRLL